MKRQSPATSVIVPILLSTVPGWGHIWVRRNTRGLALFLLFFSSANFALVRLVSSKADNSALPVQLALAFCAGVLFFTLADILRITLWTRSRRVRGQRATLFKRLLVHYLRKEYGQAKEAAERMLRINPYDTTALIYSGMVHQAMGESRRALQMFRRVLRVDTDGKWAHEATREIQALTPSSP